MAPTAENLDPSRTALLRRAYVADMRRRFNKVRSLVWDLVVRQDVFGLEGFDNSKPPNIIGNAGAWSFNTVSKKIKKFNAWLKDMVDRHILEASPQTGEPAGMKPWMYKYIDSAYKKGAVRSYMDMHPVIDYKKPAGFVEGSKQAFLESAFSRPERRDKLEMLYTRSYEDLKGVTATMSTQLSRVLTEGVAHGHGPHKIARQMTRTITGITEARAKVIARTEVIHAHAEGQLDGFEDLGVDEVDADVEFSASRGGGVCPRCKSLSGKIYTIKSARGIIPVHPNCRCSWSPAPYKFKSKALRDKYAKK